MMDGASTCGEGSREGQIGHTCGCGCGVVVVMVRIGDALTMNQSFFFSP